MTEGEVTEPEYLDGLKSEVKNPLVDIEVHGGIGVPRTIVEYARDRMKDAKKQAKRENDDNLKYEEVWCVFDVDDHPNLADAKEMARDNGLKLAVSNPCIEVWLWLHFAESPGMQDRNKLQKMMRKHIANYNKHVNYADYKNGYDDAVTRAKRLTEGVNPSTTVWRLTESIRKET
ncbi:MAG: RloB family protein [Planctomycetaceae bacterium]